MKISLIVAMTRSGVIGIQNKLPWHLPEDLKRFKELTTGHTIIMGRKTWESIGRVLPGRENIVVTRNLSYALPSGVIKASSVSNALGLSTRPQVFIIGGAELFREALSCAHNLYITWVEDSFEGDVFFPNTRLENFRVVSEERHNGSINYTLRIMNGRI